MSFIFSNARFTGINGAGAASSSAFDPATFDSVSQRPTCRIREETLDDLIDQYKTSVEWTRHACSTKKLYTTNLKRISKQYGKIELGKFEHPQARVNLIAWRATLASTPAAADNIFSVFSTLLGFAVSINKLNINVACNIGDMYRLGRRAIITWEHQEIELMVEKAEESGRPGVGDLVLLAWLTGLRLGDLVTVAWHHVNELSITRKLQKQSRGKVAVANIPLDDRLEALLVKLGARYRQSGVTTLLVDRWGAPMSGPNVHYPFSTVRDEIGIGFDDVLTGERHSKRLHDLRGTKATELLGRDSLTDEQVAAFMGWSQQYVRVIRHVYVDDKARVAGIARKANEDALSSGISIAF